jgi:adenine-specific DNA-methyltransferase
LARMATELGLPLPMTTGYYGYFMAYAWASKWSKRDVFLLPTNWLEARYGRSLRQMLLARNYGISLVENGHHSPVFDHALTTICLVITWPKHSVRNDGELAGTINVLRGPNERNIKNQISNDELAACLGQRLSNFVQGERKADHAVADVLRVRRGIATGNNEFFILSKASARTLGIGRRELIEILRRFPSDSRSIEVAYLWAPTEKPSEASLRRIAEGEKLRVNQRYLCRHRKPWWRIKVHSPPAYLLAYMGRGTPRIIENRDGLLNLNNTHGLYLREKVPTGLAMNTVEWLGSEEGIEALNNQARHYYGGLWKLEPGDVERISLPTSLF